MIDPDQLAGLADLAHRVATAGVDGLTGDELTRVALAAHRAKGLFEHLEVHALGQLERSNHTELEFGMTTAGWFAREANLPVGVARGQVNTARTLVHLELVDAAWLDGTITREHVRVFARAANPRVRDQFVAAQGDLIGRVEGRTFQRWEQDIDHLVRSWDQDGPDPSDPQNATATWSRSGALAMLKATFGGEMAEVMIQILDAKTDELFHRQKRDRELSTDFVELTRGQLRFLALQEIVLASAGIDIANAKIPQASIHLVLRPTGLPSLHPDTDFGLPGSFTDATWSLTNLDGDHLVLEHFDTLLCDCEAHVLLVDEGGNPLKLGRTVRCAPPKLRRAVLIRDGGCAVPGCGAKLGWLDIHHVKKWKDGGETDINNLVALCRYHHGITHRRGWTMHANGDGWFWWETPSGHTFWSQRHGKQRAGPAPPPMRMLAAA